MKRDTLRVSVFAPLLSGPATRRPLGVLGALGVLGVPAGVR